MKRTTISVDLAKSVFEVAVSSQPGRISGRKRLPRSRFLEFLVRHEPALVVMEACGSAHHWARRLEAMGHRVALLPPHAVRPYVHGNKTDRADAKGILEAYRNEAIHCVPVKTESQQTLTALHRLRSTWIKARTSRINTTRGLLRKFGVMIPVGARHVVGQVEGLIADGNDAIPVALRPALAAACEEIRQFDHRIAEVERQLKSLAAQLPSVGHLQSVPGIGLLTALATATAMVGVVGDVRRFRTSRRFASYLGLTPCENSSGLRRRLGSISKRGDSYLRMLLTHGARSLLWSCKAKKDPDQLRTWAIEVERRRGHNKAAIALANKLARVLWAVWTHDTDYRSRPAVAA